MQSRAEETVSAIFEATAQVLEKEGEAALNTNRIAEQAGFSIGALYQYFPNKEAILLAMAMREKERLLAQVKAALKESAELPPEETARRVVRLLLKAFGGRQRLRRMVIQAVLKSGLTPEAHRAVSEVAEELVAQLRGQARAGLRPLSEVSAFVLTRALMGAIRGAVIEASPLLQKPEFEEELVALVCAYLRAS